MSKNILGFYLRNDLKQIEIAIRLIPNDLLRSVHKPSRVKLKYIEFISVVGKSIEVRASRGYNFPIEIYLR